MMPLMPRVPRMISLRERAAYINIIDASFHFKNEKVSTE